jgi:hypothetical protein
MSTCGGATGAPAGNVNWQRNENCETDKSAARRISGPSLDQPRGVQQHVQADRSHAPRRSHGPRVAQASDIQASTKIEQAKTETVDTKIEELKKNLRIDSSLQGVELEAAVDKKIEEVGGPLKVNFTSPWDQRSKNIEARIAMLEKVPSSDTPLQDMQTIQDWKTLKQLVDLKCLLSPGVEGNISQMKSKLGMGGLEGNKLKKAVDVEIGRLAPRYVNFQKETTWGEVHDKIEEKLKTVTDPDVRNGLNRLQLAVDLKLQLPLKTLLAGGIADAEPQARSFLATLVVSKATPDVLAGDAKMVAMELRDYSAKMAQLHGGKPGDYELKIPLDASDHTKLCGALKDLADKGLITKEDVTLITTMTSPAATNPAPAVTAAR